MYFLPLVFSVVSQGTDASHTSKSRDSIPQADNARAHLWDHNENPRGKELQDWYYSNNNKLKILNDLDDHTTTHYSVTGVTLVKLPYAQESRQQDPVTL